MRILITAEDYTPKLCGVQQVVKNIAEGLYKKGHDITVAAKYHPDRISQNMNGIKIEQFKIQGNNVKGISGEVNRYRDFLLDSEFDIIFNYAAQTWTTDIFMDCIHKIQGAKVIAPSGYSALKRIPHKWFYKRYFERLPHILKKYDKIIYHLAEYQDKEFGDRMGLNNYIIIPNAVSKEEFPIENKPESYFKEKYGIQAKYILLNVSNHNMDKGHKFIIKAFKKLKIKDICLIIIGNQPKSLKNCYRYCKNHQKRFNIKVLADIPREDAVNAYYSSDVFLTGSKIESFSIVLLEAEAAGLPFISTDVGCVRELNGGLIVSSPQEMRKEISGLIQNQEKRRMLGEKGRDDYRKKYNWDVVIEEYENLFLELLERSK